MFTLAKQPLKFHEIFLASFQFWRQYYCQMLTAMLITVLIGILPGIIVPRLKNLTHMIVHHFVVANWYYLVFYSIVMLFLFGFVVHRVYSLMNQTNATTC